MATIPVLGDVSITGKGSATVDPSAGDDLVTKDYGDANYAGGGTGSKLTDLVAMSGDAIVDTDLFDVLDVSDTTMHSTGSNKKLAASELIEYLYMKGMPRVKRLGTQHQLASTTGTKVTDLDITLENGTYTWTYSLILRTTSTSVSPLLGVNFTGTGSPRMHFRFADASSSLLAELHTMDDQGSQAFGFISGMANNVETTSSPNMGSTATLAMATANTDTLVFIEGILIVTGSGNLELWHSSETATNTSVEVGSSLVVVRTA